VTVLANRPPPRLVEHDLVRRPVPTFRGHAAGALDGTGRHA